MYCGRSQRETAMKNSGSFKLLPLRDILLGGKDDYIVYLSLKDILQRFLSDVTVLTQVKTSGPKKIAKYDSKGVWYSDFFRSMRYQEIVATLPEHQRDKTPILVGFYRWGMHLEFLTCKEQIEGTIFMFSVHD